MKKYFEVRYERANVDGNLKLVNPKATGKEVTIDPHVADELNAQTGNTLLGYVTEEELAELQKAAEAPEVDPALIDAGKPLDNAGTGLPPGGEEVTTGGTTAASPTAETPATGEETKTSEAAAGTESGASASAEGAAE